jgi:protein arginine kinase
MGAGERDFFRSTVSIIGTILDCERAARDRILKDARQELTDKIYRAYGILLHARTLSIEETLNLTSALRLGIQTGLFDRTHIETINRVCLLAMPAHLQLLRDKSMDDDELSVCRADLARAAFGEIADLNA